MKWIGHHRILGAIFIFGALTIVMLARIQISHGQVAITAPLQRGTITQSVYGIGTVTANRSYQLMPGVIGTIDLKLLSIDHVLYTAPFAGTVMLLPYKVGENEFFYLARSFPR